MKEELKGEIYFMCLHIIWLIIMNIIHSFFIFIRCLFVIYLYAKIYLLKGENDA
jgi:hypothetical protein